MMEIVPVVQWELSCDGDGKVPQLPVGNMILFVSNHLNCSGKELFRRFLCIPRELLLTADQSKKSALHSRACFDHGPHLPGTPSVASETSVRYERKQRFLAKRELELFPDLFVSSEGSSVGINETMNKNKNTFHRSQSVKAERGQPFTDCTIFGDM